MDSQQCEEGLAHLAHRKAMREANLSPQRPDEAELARLDSSMKRNTALTRRLRGLTEESRAGVLTDVAAVNQARYVGEAAAALLAAPQRLRDVPAAAEVAGALHRRYVDFAPTLMAGLARDMEAAPPLDEDRGSALRRRALGRLLLELTATGVNRSPAPLVAELRALAAAATPTAGGDTSAVAAALTLLASFVKYGRDEFFVIPGDEDDVGGSADLGDTGSGAAEQPASRLGLEASNPSPDAAGSASLLEQRYRAAVKERWRAPRELRESFTGMARETYERGLAELRAVRGALRRARARDARVLLQRGDLTDAAVARAEGRDAAHDALFKALSVLGEALGEPAPPPATQDDADADEDGTTGTGPAAPDGTSEAGARPPTLNPYDDEEEREFYEDLLDLRALVPAVLLGGGARRGEDVRGDGAGVEEQEPGCEAGAEQADVDGGDETDKDGMDVDVSGDISSALIDRSSPASGSREEPAALSQDEPGADDPPSTRAGSAWQGVLDRLSTCLSKEDADAAALAFCALAPKAPARRRLVTAMLDVPWGALAALPPRARLAAVLGSVWPDVPQGLETALTSAARGQAAHRAGAGPRGLDARLRTMRYVGELVKARAFRPGTAFRLLRSLLDDFTGSNVDAAVALLDCAGRFLARWPPTAARTQAMLGVMLRLRSAKSMDARQAALVDSVAAQIRAEPGAGPGPNGGARAPRSPEQEYVRWCLYDLLPRQGPLAALRRLRCLDWATHGGYVRASMLRAAAKGSADALPALASLAAALRRWHPELAVGLVDCLLEQVAAGVEDPASVSRQRRLAGVRLLGELYAFKVVASPVIFQTLQVLCALPPPLPPPLVNLNPASSSTVYRDEAAADWPITDSGADCFRIRLATALLDVCGGFFSKGPTASRLAAALTRLEAYAALKDAPLPVHVQAELAELFARLHAPRRAFADAGAARAAVAALDGAVGSGAGPGMRAGVAGGEEDDDEAGSDDDEEEEEESSADSGTSEGASSDAGSASDEDSTSSNSFDGSDGDGSDDDITVIPPPMPDEVDEEFERELQALMMEGRHPDTAVATPAMVSAVEGGADVLGKSTASEPAPRVQMGFSVMLKRGTRDARTLRTLSIPVAPAVADGIRAREAAEASERAELKRLVLAAERRDTQEREAAQPVWQARPRGSRPRVSFTSD